MMRTRMMTVMRSRMLNMMRVKNIIDKKLNNRQFEYDHDDGDDDDAEDKITNFSFA